MAIVLGGKGHGFCKVAADDKSITCKTDGRLKQRRPGKDAVFFMDVLETFDFAGNSTAMY